MTSDVADVSAARVALARALARTQTEAALVEAEDQLRRALNAAASGPAEDSDVVAPTGPAKQEILSSLADLADRRSDHAGAIRWQVQAVLAAQPPLDGDLAQRALDLINRDPSGSAGDALPDDLAAELRSAALDRTRADGVVRLAARVALMRGEVGLAGEMTRQRRAVGAPGDADDLRAAEVASEVLELLASGQDEQAQQRLAEVSHLADDPAVTLADALVLYAAGDTEAARRRAEAYHGPGDPTAVVVLCLLREADDHPSERASLLAKARTAAARAARDDPAGGQPVLLRAQILLEGGTDLTLGRGLLHTALRRLGSFEDVPWWRIQRRVRFDERYCYVLIEAAAAEEKWEEVDRLGDRYTTETTSFEQDARAAEWRARAAPGAPQQAEHLRIAGRAYRAANDPASAVRSLRQAFQVMSDPETGLELAEVLWEASFIEDAGPDLLTPVSDGLQLMESLEGKHATTSLARVCLVWGLLLGRQDIETAGQPLRKEQRWRPLPHLLLAALLDPNASYTRAHLAWACDDADIRWPAAWAAEHATQLRGDDDWLMSTNVAASMNWCGTLDEPQRAWLRDLSADADSAGWVAAVQALELLVAGRSEDARKLLPLLTLDAWWVREIRMQVLALGSPERTAPDELQALIDEAIARGNLFDSCWLALLLDPAQARMLSEQAAAEGSGRIEQRHTASALIDLTLSDGRDGSDRLSAQLARIRRPMRLLEDINVRYPLLAAAHPDREGLQAALADLRQLGTALLSDLDARPALTVEFDSGETWCEQADLAALVRWLLERCDTEREPPSDEPAPEVPALPGARSVRDAGRLLVDR